MTGIKRFTPVSRARTRLVLAALVWSAVGIALAGVGASWLLSRGAGRGWPALLVALAVGVAKGRFILMRYAERNARRIVEAGEGRCIGGVFSWKSWLFVALMMIAGAAVRHSSVPRFWLGLVYTAAGCGLLLGAAEAWVWAVRREV